MIETVKLSDLKPASYNPRKLTQDAFENLKASLTELGLVKPIVVRRQDNLIIAGHQRTKTMLALGMTEAPAFIVENVNTSDEVRFNQMHNFTESEVSERAPVLRCRLPEGASGYVELQPDEIEVVRRGDEGQKIYQLSKMILKHGQFASCVCDCNGVVLISAIYGLAAKLNNLPLLVYVLPKGLEGKCVEFFSKEYGQFCYDEIERETYIQTLAQRFRLRKSQKDQRQMAGRCHSTLYENCVIPFITKEMRVLDFGAGHKDYQLMLAKKGYRIDALEFYYRHPKTNTIDFQQVQKDFDCMCENITRNGLYDVVVCDSVLNSVDSVDAEKSVLVTLSALCRQGGVVFWSGIPLAFKTRVTDLKTQVSSLNNNIFLDKDNFTANLREGHWFFQKYHSREDIERLTRHYIGNDFEIFDLGKPTKREPKLASFQVKAVNERPCDWSTIAEALKFEFTLPLPNGKRYEFDKKIIEVLRKYIA